MIFQTEQPLLIILIADIRQLKSLIKKINNNKLMNRENYFSDCDLIINSSIFLCMISGEVSSDTVSTGTVPRGGERVEAADLGRHTDKFDESTLAANTAIDARGGSPQGAHLSGAVTPRPPRGRRRPNQNGLDTTQVR